MTSRVHEMASSLPTLEAIIENGRCVYSKCYEADSPCGSGVMTVHVLDGLYAADLDDGEYFGPYSSLINAIASHEELFVVLESTTEIKSSELSIDEIEGLLKPSDCLEGKTITLMINGNKRVFNDI